MYLFLLILLPASLFIYYNTIGEKKCITLTFAGFITAIVVCGIRFLFFFSHRIVPHSFIINALFYFTRLVFIPLILYALFVLISKDTAEFKIKSFFPLVAAFNAVYLPYYFLTMSVSVYSNYDLFFRPIIYLAFLIGTSIALQKIYESHLAQNKKQKILYIIMAVVYMFVPSLVDTSYVTNLVFPVFATLAIIYIAFPLVLLFLRKKIA